METPEMREDNEAAPNEPPPPVAQARPSLEPPSPPVAEMPQKSPVLAAFLSFLPGLGNIYNGLYRRAVLFFLIYVSFFSLAINSRDEEKAFLIPCVVFTWFFNIFDAYRQATLINFGVVEESRPLLRGWGLAPGVFLLLFGIYGLLRQHVDIDLAWVVDQWPWALIAFGAWMIYQHFKERRSEQEQEA